MRRLMIPFFVAALALLTPASAYADYRLWLSNQTSGRVDILVDATPTCSLVRFTGSNFGDRVSCTVTLSDGAHIITAVRENGALQAFAANNGMLGHLEIADGSFLELGRGPPPSASPISVPCQQYFGYPVLWLTSCTAAIQAGGGVEPRVNRSLYYFDQRDFRGALADLDVVVMLEPESWLYRAIRCNTRVEGNIELETAMQDCADANRLSQGQSPWPFIYYAALRARRGEWGAAQALADAAVQKDPGSSWALYIRGVARTRLGQTSQGQSDINAAIALDRAVAGEMQRRYALAP